jgi:tetratricopeptide (TPR) repeat protein
VAFNGSIVSFAALTFSNPISDFSFETMVQKTRTHGGRGATGYAPYLQVEIANQWSKNQHQQQHLLASHHQERRYSDNFAVSSRPHFVQPRSSAPVAAPVVQQYDERLVENDKEDDTMGDVASTLVECGVEHHTRGEYELALKAFRAALKAQRLNLGTEHLCIAHTLGNIGAVYLRQGKLFLAANNLDEALRTKIKFRTKEQDPKNSNISLAGILNNLGNIAYLRGDYERSHKYYKSTLKDLRSSSSSSSSSSNRKAVQQSQIHLAHALHNIGRLHILQHEWFTARSVLAECHRIEVQVHGPRDLLLVDTLELLGYVHFCSSSLKNDSLHLAMTAFSEALTILRHGHGKVHPAVATCLLHIGMVLEARGDLQDAWDMYSRAQDIFLRSSGTTNGSHRGLDVAQRSMAKMEQKLLVIVKDKNASEPSKKPSSPFVPIGEPELDSCSI